MGESALRLGDQLNGYEVITDPTNAGGGMSQWAFAKKDSGEYFLKMFLAPKYPLDDGPGSEAAKARKRATCIAFEQASPGDRPSAGPDQARWREPRGGSGVLPGGVHLCEGYGPDRSHSSAAVQHPQRTPRSWF